MVAFGRVSLLVASGPASLLEDPVALVLEPVAWTVVSVVSADVPTALEPVTGLAVAEDRDDSTALVTELAKLEAAELPVRVVPGSGKMAVSLDKGLVGETVVSLETVVVSVVEATLSGMDDGTVVVAVVEVMP